MQYSGNSDPNEIIKALRSGVPGVIEYIYDTYRPSYLTWAKGRFKTGMADIEDSWQEVVVAFYEKVMHLKLTNLECSLKTYLFAIGFYQLCKNDRKLRRLYKEGDIDDFLKHHPDPSTFEIVDPFETEKEILNKTLGDLSPRCQELLIKRHYFGMKIPELMKEYNYSSNNSMMVTLNDCLNKLKNKIKELTKK